MEAKYIQGDVLIHPLWDEGKEVDRIIFDDELEAYFYTFLQHVGVYAEKDLTMQIPRPEPKFLIEDYAVYSRSSKNKDMACEIIDMYFQGGTWQYEIIGVVAETVKEDQIVAAEEHQIPKFQVNTFVLYLGKKVRVFQYLPMFFFKIQIGAADWYIVHQNDLEEIKPNAV